MDYTQQSNGVRKKGRNSMNSSSRAPIHSTQYIPAGLIVRHTKQSWQPKVKISPNESNNRASTLNGRNHVQSAERTPPKTICQQRSPRSLPQLLNKSPTSLYSAGLAKSEDRQYQSTPRQQDSQDNHETIQLNPHCMVNGSKGQSNIFPVAKNGRLVPVPHSSPKKASLPPTEDSCDSDDSWGEDNISSSSVDEKFQAFGLNNIKKVSSPTAGFSNIPALNSKNDSNNKSEETNVHTSTNSKKNCSCGNCANYADCPTWRSKNIVFGKLKRDDDRKGVTCQVESSIFTATMNKGLEFVPHSSPKKASLPPTEDSCDSDDSWGEDNISSSSVDEKFQAFALDNSKKVSSLTAESCNIPASDIFNGKSDSGNQSEESNVNSKKNCSCGNCANYADCPTWCSKNIIFEELQREDDRKGMPLLQVGKFKDNFNIRTFSDKNMIIYGTYIFSPMQSLEETAFKSFILKGLEEINSKELELFNSYMLMSILRSLNVVAIGRGGEFESSLIYLPAFCGFAMEKAERYVELKYEGPLILIVMPTEEKCLKLHSFLKKWLPSIDDNFSVGVLLNDNSINCDIIITTPTAVDLNLRLENLKLKRLCHVAVEDASEVLQSNMMGQFLKLLHRLQENRPHNKSLQVVMCSEKVTPELLTTINSFYSFPIIGFNDFLEAALLCNIEFIHKKINSNHKVFYLTDVLKVDNASNKFVVFCADSEIDTIEKHCIHNGIAYMTILKDMTMQDVSEVNYMWTRLTSDVSKVLLCSDSMLEQIDVVCANRVFHYSAPSTWEEFQRRHRVLSKNLESPFKNGKGCDAISYIVQDEKSEFFDNFHEIKKRKVLIQHAFNQMQSL